MSTATTDARTAAGSRARTGNYLAVYAGCQHLAPTAATFTGPASVTPSRAATSTPLAHPTTPTASRHAPACAAHGLNSSSPSSSSSRKAAS
ncbi:hypothetical protein AB0945_20115 [Streptomyces sp. NPDC005474]|uniref:hypothetical protein n=1 Tax=Streptomyces sp. NPDC005474 TaxID=3154878 RepID=UPI0034561E3C